MAQKKQPSIRTEGFFVCSAVATRFDILRRVSYASASSASCVERTCPMWRHRFSSDALHRSVQYKGVLAAWLAVSLA
ncbi:hypothetical protein PWP93_01360 [Paraburkholderia sp. A1RI-2L]|uniref:hypothetical protein n=1 Tax=Paraburkholderia sp. A1RI-2L TaxID=3028367 RepID=UPI003B793BD8